MVGILVSFWDGLFSGVMLVSGRVRQFIICSTWFELSNLKNSRHVLPCIIYILVSGLTKCLFKSLQQYVVELIHGYLFVHRSKTKNILTQCQSHRPFWCSSFFACQATFTSLRRMARWTMAWFQRCLMTQWSSKGFITTSTTLSRSQITPSFTPQIIPMFVQHPMSYKTHQTIKKYVFFQLQISLHHFLENKIWLYKSFYGSCHMTCMMVWNMTCIKSHT